jgi:hypothetical protein
MAVSSGTGSTTVDIGDRQGGASREPRLRPQVNCLNHRNIYVSSVRRGGLPQFSPRRNWETQPVLYSCESVCANPHSERSSQIMIHPHGLLLSTQAIHPCGLRFSAKTIHSRGLPFSTQPSHPHGLSIHTAYLSTLGLPFSTQIIRPDSK